jgi:hypothetical protein
VELRQEADRFAPSPAEFVAGRSRPVGHGPKRNQGYDVVEGCPARATARATRPISDRPSRGAPVSGAPGPAP